MTAAVPQDIIIVNQSFINLMFCLVLSFFVFFLCCLSPLPPFRVFLQTANSGEQPDQPGEEEQ